METLPVESVPPLDPALAVAAIAHLSDGVIAVDAEARLLFANDAARRMHGDVVIGASAGYWAEGARILGADGRAAALEQLPLQRALRTGRTVADETWRLRRADGTELVLLVTASPVRDAAGQLVGATLVLRDVTRELTRQRLHAKEERERLIAELEDERRRLSALAAQAEAASSAKTAFLATMSHELRTPLNAILGYTELMEIGIAGPVSDVQRTYHERVRHSARHLLGLIGEVLDLSKVESGRLTVHRERVTLLRESSAALALVRPQAAARGLRLTERTLCDGELAACADAGRVRQVLLNLLANAVKFTQDGGMVLLECGQASDHVWMRVVDSGIGIPEGQLERVFEPFVQASDDATSPYRRTQGGTGLGLAISRQLARLMGGDLVVESTPGLGSTFTLRLPMWDRAQREAGRAGAVAADGVPRHVRVALGSTLAACADHIVKTWADRLRVDPEVPQARDRADAEIEDHVGAFLADFAQHFVILDEPGVDRASLVGDGVKIQRMIAELHGSQRARLGWTESALVRELRMLVEEIDRTMREKLGTAGELEDSLALVRAFLREAGRETVEAFRVARAVRAARDAALDAA